MARIEDKLQHDIIVTFNRKYPLLRQALFHVNNNAVGGAAGARMKAMGVLAGVSDLILLTPNKSCIFIELKTDKGSTSKQQDSFRAFVQAIGFRYMVVRSVEEFMKIAESVWIEKS